MNQYYRANNLKLSYGEFWNITRSPLVLIPWTAKLLGIRMNLGSTFPRIDCVRDLEVPEPEISARAREQLQDLLIKCLVMGFRSPRYFSYESLRRDTRTEFISMLHASGATVRLMFSRSAQGTTATEKTVVVLLSELRDGTFFFTADQHKLFNDAPGILPNRLPGVTPEQLLESHLQSLGDFETGNPAKPVATADQLDDLWDRYEKHSFEHGMKRGIYDWVPPEEVAADQQSMTSAMEQAGDSGEYAGVILELQRLQDKKSGWGNMILILIVSMGLFIGAGSREWTWEYLFIVLGVLFVHETGHYLAMRAFNYRNLRMFFIPFFGAAVSGQNHNVAGWKKVVVSLMGPLPGIVLGILLGFAGFVTNLEILKQIAIVALLLNGFNLLPVLPLDGGWVLHTLLFSRHSVLDAVFRLLAAVAMMAAGLLLDGKMMMFLGIFMLIGVPLAFRTARIAEDLRKRGLPPALPDEQSIPLATARTIIEEVKNSIPGSPSNQIIARQTLQIFETLNARPPGWPATLGLLVAHAAGFVLAVVFALAFIVAQHTPMEPP